MWYKSYQMLRKIIIFEKLTRFLFIIVRKNYYFGELFFFAQRCERYGLILWAKSQNHPWMVICQGIPVITLVNFAILSITRTGLLHPLPSRIGEFHYLPLLTSHQGEAFSLPRSSNSNAVATTHCATSPRRNIGTAHPLHGLAPSRHNRFAGLRREIR